MFKIFDGNIILDTLLATPEKEEIVIDNSERGNTLIIEVFDALDPNSETVSNDAFISMFVKGETGWCPEDHTFLDVGLATLIYANPQSLCIEAATAGEDGDVFAQRVSGAPDIHFFARGTEQSKKRPCTIVCLGSEAFDKIRISLSGGSGVISQKAYMHVSLGIA